MDIPNMKSRKVRENQIKKEEKMKKFVKEKGDTMRLSTERKAFWIIN